MPQILHVVSYFCNISFWFTILHGCQFTNVSLEEPFAPIFHCEANKYFVYCTILLNCFGHTGGIYYLTLIDPSIRLIVESLKWKQAPHA